ncbi:MAG: HEPN domain-containing protein [Prochlorococcaceae cyanobacterium]
MADWFDTKSMALSNAETSLNSVDELLTLVKDGKGKPSGKERAVFAAAVVFLYGIWENFVEQLAIELVTHLSPDIDPTNVPEQVRKSLEKKSAWELSVHPGWRSLWAESVKLQAVGDDGDKFGMNTAKSGQVKNLLVTAGAYDCFAEASDIIIPGHLAEITKVEDAVNRLVELRGEIVHTGKVPDSLRKSHVMDWKSFVRSVCESVDECAREQSKVLS